jgi:hypothetical protein
LTSQSPSLPQKIIWPEERTTSTNVADLHRQTPPPIHHPPTPLSTIQKPHFQSYSNLIKHKTQLKFHSQTPKLSSH